MLQCGNAFFLNRQIKPAELNLEIKSNRCACKRTHHADGTKGQSKGDEHGRRHTANAIHHGRAGDGGTDHITKTD